MDEIRIKKNIARNISTYRKRCDLTQAQLADKISYSDKAVSKWERAEGVPDVFVMLQMCELFNISLNDMVADKPKKQAPYFLRNRFIISVLSCAIVWLIAVFTFVLLGFILPENQYLWLSYIYAIPITFIVLTVFSSIWWNKWMKLISISGIVWSFLISLYLTLEIFTGGNANWMVFLIGIPVEFMFIFFFLLRKKTNV